MCILFNNIVDNKSNSIYVTFLSFEGNIVFIFLNLGSMSLFSFLKEFNSHCVFKLPNVSNIMMVTLHLRSYARNALFLSEGVQVIINVKVVGVSLEPDGAPRLCCICVY